MTEESIRTAEQHLAKIDPLLAPLIASQRLEPLVLGGDYFASLARSIIGQQVSVAAARAISGRFEDTTHYNPKAVVSLTEDDMRAIGLSRQKASYIRDLAGHFVENPLVYNHLGELSDDEVISDLTAVKGIGVWTAQMFLIFTLGRPDVFAPDDVGLQRAMLQLHKWEVLPPKKELALIAEQWQPYRSIASLHLWQSLDAKPA